MLPSFFHFGVFFSLLSQVVVGDAKYNCSSKCAGNWPYSCSPGWDGLEALRCKGSGCQYLQPGELGHVSWCIYRNFSAPADSATWSDGTGGGGGGEGGSGTTPTTAPTTTPTDGDNAAQPCNITTPPVTTPPGAVLRPTQTYPAIVDIPKGGGYMEGHEEYYLGSFEALIADSYSEMKLAPQSLKDACVHKPSISNPSNLPEVILTSKANSEIATISAAEVTIQCGTASICVVPKGLTLLMNGNLNVAALVLREGTLQWDASTQSMKDQFLCAGYIAVEGSTGEFKLHLSNAEGADKRAWIYIKDNGAKHFALGTRAFGSIGSTTNKPTLDLAGRPLRRTWTLLAESLKPWDQSMKVMHDPILMGWRVGDRIQVAPTKGGSQGEAQTFVITKFDHYNRIWLDTWSWDEFQSENQFIEQVPAVATGTNSNTYSTKIKKTLASLRSAEVINLSRNIIVTGDDFRQIDCDPSLIEDDNKHRMSSQGCHCRTNVRTKCTVGLHTIAMYGGLTKFQHVRVEKCGQRGILGKYCMHPHLLGDCPNCIFNGNAIEYSHQRAINVHGTHRMTVSNNVMTDVRGSAIYIEDGNEMWNDLHYNVAICPWKLNDPYKRGCTIPGSPNGQADTALNQVGIWLSGAVNNMIGNRMANSFNGMLVDVNHAGSGLGPASGLTCIAGERIGHWEGNTFHSHGRFGTYGLGNFFPKRKVGELQVMPLGHFQTSQERNNVCANGNGDFNVDGTDAGWSHAIKNNFDWKNTFVGHYGTGDVQYMNHVSINNNNLIYWKTSKSFADGCSALFKNGYYSQGNLALPDEGTFLFENIVIDGPVTMEANHHCDVGSTGVLCQPHYIFVNTRRKWNSKSNWLYFQGGDSETATAHGGIFGLSPPDCKLNLGRTNAEAEAIGSLLPGGYCSVVDRRYTYLAGTNFCDYATDVNVNGITGSELNTRYGKGILCKAPLRALKIFSHSLRKSTSKNLRVEMWLTAKTAEEQNSRAADYTMDLPIHIIGDDGDPVKDDAKQPQNKQGYSLPVIPITPNVLMTHSYRISLGNNLSPIPTDWIIEFSDPVFGHRWNEEKIRLNVVGRQCGPNSGTLIVSSQHDRKYLVSDDGGLNRALRPTGKGRGRGACTSHPKMPDIECEQTPALDATECPGLCAETCNQDLSYCDCGTATCVCRPGYTGDQCEIDLCGAARCSGHGACSAQYLGGDLPVSLNACICESPWTGPLCDQNLCASDSLLYKSCSGKGTCVHSGDDDTRCECNQGYSGVNCENSCDGKCAGNGGVFPYGCAGSADVNTYALQCGPQGGCSYPQTKSGMNQNWCAYFSRANEKNSNIPECVTENDCRLAPKYNCTAGMCDQGLFRPDGTPCNSKPWGICKDGECVVTNDLAVANTPSATSEGSSYNGAPSPTSEGSSYNGAPSPTSEGSSYNGAPSPTNKRSASTANTPSPTNEGSSSNGVNVIIGVVISVVLIGIVGSVIFYLHHSVSKGKQQQSSLASKTDTNVMKDETWSSKNDKMDETSEWTVHIDSASGISYYAHKKTGRTTWSDPRGIELASLSNPMNGIELSTNPMKGCKGKSKVERVNPMSSNNEYLETDASGGIQWRQHETDEHVPYYENTETGRTTWTARDGAGKAIL